MKGYGSFKVIMLLLYHHPLDGWNPQVIGSVDITLSIGPIESHAFTCSFYAWCPLLIMRSLLHQEVSSCIFLVTTRCWFLFLPDINTDCSFWVKAVNKDEKKKKYHSFESLTTIVIFKNHEKYFHTFLRMEMVEDKELINMYFILKNKQILWHTVCFEHWSCNQYSQGQKAKN